MGNAGDDSYRKEDNVRTTYGGGLRTGSGDRRMFTKYVLNRWPTAVGPDLPDIRMVIRHQSVQTACSPAGEVLMDAMYQNRQSHDSMTEEARVASDRDNDDT
ncbi:hypothetical protein DPMN_034169 [Dreissena polymorpha]|uniref:Uncharacterized protein n=1 Tax=Dreissena polymorpha TaxID=45954 RepID=A0A9D4RLU4_DREPO|nr:hypothetical protein DPMN_034169 [Dreissena polymorpha]